MLTFQESHFLSTVHHLFPPHLLIPFCEAVIQGHFTSGKEEFHQAQSLFSASVVKIISIFCSASVSCLHKRNDCLQLKTLQK